MHRKPLAVGDCLDIGQRTLARKMQFRGPFDRESVMISFSMLVRTLKVDSPPR
jgi:hypothetical protein